MDVLAKVLEIIFWIVICFVFVFAISKEDGVE
jgi:hypothetical protein